MKWWRYSGIFLIVTGIGHILIGVLLGLDRLLAIANGHFTDLLIKSPEHTAFFWYVVSGLLVIYLGHLSHWAIKRTNLPLPSFLGWYLLLTTIVLGIYMPVSAIWLVIPQAFIILKANYWKS